MKLKLAQFSRWISIWTAVVAMVTGPVAMGKEVENISMQTMQNALIETGLNKSMTYGEFFEKNKAVLPERIRRQMAPVMAQFKNQKMPKFELASSKGPNGLVVPTLRVSQNGESITTQWFGEDHKYVKVGNTQLSRIDIINFDDMIQRIMAGDEKYRKQANVGQAERTKKRSFAQVKYPDLNKREWASMTDYDKAAYIVNLRMLWLDARKVLAEKKKSNSKKTKTSENFFEKNEKYFDLIFGQDANAKAAKVVTESRTTEYYNGDSCIVAGYVARYDKNGREFCNHGKIDEIYHTANNSLYVKAKEYCQSKSAGDIACNPSVFGTPGGAPTCITPSRAQSFQEATTWNGPCDSASRLQANKTNFLKQDKDIGRYAAENMLLSDQARKEAALTEEGKNSFKLTESYLLGVLKFRKTIGENVTSLFDKGVLDNTVLEQILIDKKGFDNEIEEANHSCQIESDASMKARRNHEPNYWKACDQLKNRFLFIEALFASKCTQGKLGADLKCSCENPKGAAVVPGAKCSAESATPIPPIIPPVANPEPVKPRDCATEFYGASNLSADCKCSSGQYPTAKLTGIDTGQKHFSCNESEVIQGTVVDSCTGLFCSTFLKKMLLVGGAIVGSVVLYKVIEKVFAVKKPAIKSPGDGCPDGGVAPCRPVCTAPFVYNTATSTCTACAACPPGQTADAANSCNCTSSAATPATPGTTLFTCPDNTSQRTDLTQCPTYTCTTVSPPVEYQNPANCPTASPSNATPPTGTGSPGKTR